MSKFFRLPGLIDIHVHLRDPGQIHKEDFYTGTCSALAGGIVTVFDMPNNKEPIISYERLIQKIKIAGGKAVCNWGLYFGTDGKNIGEFEKVKDLVVGLKVYLSLTTGKFLIEDACLIEKIFQAWPRDKVVVVHAEGEKMDLALSLCRKYKNKIHITHVAAKNDLEKILMAKKDNLPITCDVTPHHLFLTKNQKGQKNTSGVGEPYNHLGSGRQAQGARHDSPEVNKSDKPSNNGGMSKGLLSKEFYSVKPPLATKGDQKFLWENIDKIDCIATDHAPHTIKEKMSDNSPSGLPGLETSLPLLLTAVNEGRLTIEDIVRLTSSNPRKIFGIGQNEGTYVEVDMEEEYFIENKNLFTKCGWSPFEGWKAKGKVKEVYIRGTKVFDGTKITVPAGFGRNISGQ